MYFYTENCSFEILWYFHAVIFNVVLLLLQKVAAVKFFEMSAEFNFTVTDWYDIIPACEYLEWLPQCTAVDLLKLPMVNLHWRLHMGANGVSWPPGKMDEKLKNKKHAKKQFSMFVLYFESNQGRQM